MGTSADTPRLPQRVKRLYLLQSQAIDDALKAHGLARSQWQVLKHVRCAGTLTQKELQGLLHVEPATLTCIIDTLVAKGWMERLENASDKRVRVVRLTAEGEQRWESIPDVVDGVETRMLDGVSEHDARVLADVVETMIANLERRQRD
jgi:DNA-binding MarR family transcriptional regulator